MKIDDFYKFATGHQNINPTSIDKYLKHTSAHASNIVSMTPNVIEERQLNIIPIDVFSRLMMERIIFLGFAIDDYVANIIVAQLLWLQSTDPKRDVTIYINSPGGSVTSGLAIYDVMQHIIPDVVTTVVGMAASMAAVLLCAGTHGKRSALPHSRVMIHQPMGGASGQASDIEIVADQIKQYKKRLYEIIASHTGQPFDKVWQDSDRDYWMWASDAKEYGIIDEVVSKEKK